MLAAPGALAADKNRATGTSAQSDPADAEAAIPSFDLVDLRNGRSVDLARLRTPGRAMLVWLWAPGCPVCNAEAREIEQFARQERLRLTVLGIGTQGDQKAATAFAKRHNLQSVRMLWSKDEALFDYYGVLQTPSTLLIDGSFRQAGDWSGRTPIGQVRKALNRIAPTEKKG